jgi:uncharacterized membrane protein
MKSIRARLAALAAGYLLALLATHGLAEVTPDLAARVQSWVEHTFELVLFVGYAVVHPWIQKRWNPTGAYTGEAARKLEHMAHVERPA